MEGSTILLTNEVGLQSTQGKQFKDKKKTQRSNPQGFSFVSFLKKTSPFQKWDFSPL